MIKLLRGGVYYMEGRLVKENVAFMVEAKKQKAIKNTLTYGILKSHNKGSESELKIKFDSLVSHDLNYVGIIRSAIEAGLEKFPVPYTLTNCHNLVNADDRKFGLTAAQKFGGNFVPQNLAVIHRCVSEVQAKSGGMILASDSHARYGALGTMAIGEGEPELVKQLLSKTYDIARPEVIAVYLKGKPKKGVGPHDVAIALIAETVKNGFLKNKVLEFIGPGIKNLSMDFRCGIDVMAAETSCLSSVWETDDKTKEFFAVHGREGDFKPLTVAQPAYYDGGVVIDLSTVDPMIALPLHPSGVFTLREFIDNASDILATVEEEGNKLLKDKTFKLVDKVQQGKAHVSQGVIAGCLGGSYENIAEASDILNGKSCGNGEFELSVHPQSQPIFKALADNGCVSSLIGSGAIIKPVTCGFDDMPAKNGLSIRHAACNFGAHGNSKFGEGQLSAVALMDARSIAATAANGGVLTPATEVEYTRKFRRYFFDKSIYENSVYRGNGKPDKKVEVVYGHDMPDYPAQIALADNVLIKVVSVLKDQVTTTEEFIPFGETSSIRSNPLKLAQFTLSNKDPDYLKRAKAVKSDEDIRRAEGKLPEGVLKSVGITVKKSTVYGSCVAAKNPGEGFGSDLAASCQRVLGGIANIALEYATNNYRSDLINFGMLPLVCRKFDFKKGDYIYIENIRKLIEGSAEVIPAKHISGSNVKNITLELGALTDEQKRILLSGSLVNYYKSLLSRDNG